jgi:hypothetical protein
MSLLDDGIQIASGSLIREPEQFNEVCERCYRADGDYICAVCGKLVCAGFCGVLVDGKTYCQQCEPVESEEAA